VVTGVAKANNTLGWRWSREGWRQSSVGVETRWRVEPRDIKGEFPVEGSLRIPVPILANVHGELFLPSLSSLGEFIPS
jgi:hypothetical protein